MLFHRIPLFALFFALSIAFSPPKRKGGPRPSHRFANYVAVANRAGASFSLVNPETFQSIDFNLPDNGEPMYFAGLFFPTTPRPIELWVGDRANNRLVITLLKKGKIVLDGFLPTPAGLFHSMTTQNFDSRRPFVFTTCDIDNVTIVHNIKKRKEICLLKPPANVAALGAKPHDITSDDKYAFVTYIGASNGFGYVASYKARSCKLITYIRTAKDPHVALRPGARLWIAAQGGEVLSRSVPFLTPLSNDTSQPSPHGMFISYNLKYVYITNIAEGGTDAIVVYKQDTGEKMNCPQVNTTFPVPHNPATSLDGKKLYITHSGATSDVNSAWDVGPDGCLLPDSEVVFKTATNPFGTFVLPPPMRRS